MIDMAAAMTNWVEPEASAKTLLWLEDKSNGTPIKAVINQKIDFRREEAAAQEDMRANTILKLSTKGSLIEVCSSIPQVAVEFHPIEREKAHRTVTATRTLSNHLKEVSK